MLNSCMENINIFHRMECDISYIILRIDKLNANYSVPVLNCATFHNPVPLRIDGVTRLGTKACGLFVHRKVPSTFSCLLWFEHSNVQFSLSNYFTSLFFSLLLEMTRTFFYGCQME